MKFVEILAEHNIDTAPENHEHSRPGWIQIDCPFCGRGSKKFHMGYNLAGKYVHCWKCGSNGLIYTLSKLTGLSFKKCEQLIDDVRIEKVKQKKHEGKLVMPKGIGDLLPAHIRYLKKRNYDPVDLINLWHIKGIGIASKLSWRIFIPITFKGDMVSWTTRSIKDNCQMKYITASKEHSSIPIKSVLYGEEYCGDTIIICEGPFDVWRIGPGAVATLGTSYTQTQLLRMAKFRTRVICFDSERDAQRRAKKLADDLSVFNGNTYKIHLEGGDPGNMNNKMVKTLRRKFLD